MYSALSNLFPSLFPTYSQVLEKEAYERLTAILTLTAAFLSVFLISLFTGIYDNVRYESVISETDGLFKIPEKLPSYVKSVLPSDIIAALLPQLPLLALTQIKYSEKLLDYFGWILRPHFILVNAFSIPGAYFLIALFVLLARLAACPFALRRYRALWLTSFVDG